MAHDEIQLEQKVLSWYHSPQLVQTNFPQRCYWEGKLQYGQVKKVTFSDFRSLGQPWI